MEEIKIKTCNQCKIEKELHEFVQDNNKKSGYRNQCKKCHGKTMMIYYKKKREKYLSNLDENSIEYLRLKELERIGKLNKKEKKRDGKLRDSYGITIDQQNIMLQKQDNKCKICNNELIHPWGISIDHSHKTGKIRNILCRTCNTGLGHFKDSPELLLKAAEYLKLHQEPILTNKIEELIPLN